MPRKKPVPKANAKSIELTPSQAEAMSALDKAMSENKRLFVLWYGGIRAGKSVGACLLMLQHSMQRSGKEYIVAGYSQRQVINILTPTFEKFAEYYGLSYKLVRGSQNARMEIGDNVFLIYGGGDAGKSAAVQGLTAAGLLLDEYSLLHREFIAQCEARVSEQGALRVYTSNKVAPYDWTTLYYYNRARDGEIDALLLDTSTDENQHLDTSFIAERNLEYDDIHRMRFMENEFQLNLPPVYKWITDKNPKISQTKNAFSVILSDGAFYREVSAIETDYGMCIVSETQLSFTEVCQLPYDKNNRLIIYLDASRATLRKHLLNRGYTVRGIRAANMPRRVESAQQNFLLNKLQISDDAFGVLRALDEYTFVGNYSTPIVAAIEFLATRIKDKTLSGVFDADIPKSLR